MTNQVRLAADFDADDPIIAAFKEEQLRRRKKGTELLRDILLDWYERKTQTRPLDEGTVTP